LTGAGVGENGSGAWARRNARSIAVIGMVCGYALCSHFAVTTGRTGLAWASWSCLVGAIALALPWKAGVPVALALLAPLAWIPAETLLRIPPAVIYLALGAWFGRTLLPGRQPLISGFASLERGQLDPELARYTRRLTAVWSAFFAVMAVLSGASAVLGDAHTWSLVTNGVNYVLMALLFFGEYAYRRVRYSRYPHASLPRMIRIMLTAGRTRRPAADR
jgi:uncharacterized membrane protein